MKSTEQSEPNRPAKPITTEDEHRLAVDQLAERLAGDADAVELARNIERLVRFESERGIPDDQRLSARLAALAQPPARRTALIADIHGNLAALRAALDDIGRQRCDRILCLGDLVDGGPDDEGVVETLVGLGVPCIRGNHDEIDDAALSESARRSLLDLPERIVDGDVLFTHISPRPATRVVKDEIEAWQVFEEHDFRLIFLGHARVPHIFGKRSASHGEATAHEFEHNRPFCLSAEDSYIVSIESIWHGREADRKIRYAICDREAGAVELRAIDEPEAP